MKFLFFLAWVIKHTLGIHNLCELLVAKLFVDPGVGYSYTRTTGRVHVGVQIVYIRVEMKFVHQQNK